MAKRIIRLRHKLVHALDLPPEAAEGELRVQLLGRACMLVENHKGIYEYRSDLVRVQSADGMLHIKGDGLILRELSRSRLFVGGSISGFFYELTQ